MAGFYLTFQSYGYFKNQCRLAVQKFTFYEIKVMRLNSMTAAVQHQPVPWDLAGTANK